MGLLSEGSPLTWAETESWADHVKISGIQQFINLYNALKSREGDSLKWGDEIEYIIVKFDHERRVAKVSLRAQEILSVLTQPEMDNPLTAMSLWRPEYGSYMLESTPGQPYGHLLLHFNTVQANMAARRKEAQSRLPPDEMLLSIGNFPRLGCPGFTYPAAYQPNTQSCFFPEEATFQGHPRFATLARNIRQRRGSKVQIQIPIFQDEQTPNPFVEPGILEQQRPNMIYLDAPGFGMGMCCLQVTFQACNISEARTLYDNLAPLCPIMLALSAATPFYRGYISDVDARWNVITASTDDRRRGERSTIPKSRYNSIDSYLCEENVEYNDIPLICSATHLDTLKSAGVDPLLAAHVAHLFIRDPLLLFSEKIHQDNERDSDHFENIQSTNWQTLRFKPPPPPSAKSEIGWRVEFRPCEVQLTDAENAAMVSFVALLTRVVLSYNLCFLIPISKVDDNMKRAARRNALHEQKFWFRSNIRDKNAREFSPMTVNEIINGAEEGGGFPGLIPLIQTYLNTMDVDADTRCTLQQYLSLISRRASGEIMTAAAWMRDFVTAHPAYKRDSVISEEINYDLLMRIGRLADEPDPKLLGDTTRFGSKKQ